MADVEVHTVPASDGWRCAVTVREGSSQTQHEVTLSRQAYDQLSRGRVSPEALVPESFAFLLEREPKQSILGRFDLTVIGRYFPEFEADLRRRLEH
jgi:hypothetical protein